MAYREKAGSDGFPKIPTDWKALGRKAYEAAWVAMFGATLGVWVMSENEQPRFQRLVNEYFHEIEAKRYSAEERRELTYEQDLALCNRMTEAASDLILISLEGCDWDAYHAGVRECTCHLANTNERSIIVHSREDRSNW